MEKGFDIRTILKAKMVALRQRQQNKPMTPTQMKILETARKKDALEHRFNSEEALCEEQYEDYSDGANCYDDYADGNCNDYYDA